MLVAWTLIVEAGKAENALPLKKALENISPHVDAVYVQLNTPKGIKISPKVRKAAEEWTNHIYEYEWANNFAKARNDLFAKVPKSYGWIGWMDIDDTVDYPENIHAVCAVMPTDVDAIHILYDYQKDDFGNVVVSHWTCRIVRNNDSYHWTSSFDDEEAAVHETLMPRRGNRAVSNNELKVIHEASPEHFKDSLIRNIEILEKMLMRHAKLPAGPDPRILFYLGTHYTEAFRFNDARQLFIEYLKLSGWREERSEAHVYMGRFFRDIDKNYPQSRIAFLQALAEYPQNPNAYLELGRLEARDRRWENAAHWFEQGTLIEVPMTGMVRFNNNWELYTEYAQALSNIGGKQLNKALKMAQKAFKLRPDDPVSEVNRASVIKLVRLRNNMQALANMVREHRENKTENQILPLVHALPLSLSDSPLVQQILQDYTPAQKWPKKSIAIYCGTGPLERWGPDSLNSTGIGGSEEAVIRLSQELNKLGWKVTIYAMPDVAGDHDGVMWQNYWDINNKDTFDVLVSWREPAFFDFDWKARKKYLWLHDVLPADEFTKERLDSLDKIIYVSSYHANRPESKHIKASKKFISGNGINPFNFKELDGEFERDPHKCIYMSANERGLRILYEIWPDVIKAVPDATLDVYYGWYSFDAIQRDNPERMAWKGMMRRLAQDLPGVTEHGRIPQDQLNKEIFKSGIFAYPCIFPEVNCITAQKAMAGGAVPVTSDFAVLKDLITYGEQVPMNKFEAKDIKLYRDRLIAWLKNPKKQEAVRQEMMEFARDKFKWSATAQEWSDEFQTS